MKIYKAIVIDDEESAIRNLCHYIAAASDKIEVVATAHNPLEGIKEINKHHPDLIFLDISMPLGSGFDLLKALEKVDFEVIFVTAHEEFSIQALRERAFDYVLKPLFSDEFNQVIQRFLDKKASEQKNQLPTKLFFPNTNGIEVIEIDNISYCKADNVYTSIIKNDGVEILVSKPFKTILEMLAKDNFMRIHRSFLANMSQVARYSNEDGGLLHFKNGHKIPISNSYKKEILRFLS